CGAGEILVHRKARLPATSFVGYEMSEQAFKLAATRERDGIHYVKGNLLEFDESFGALLCIDVFEHVDDYIGFIKALKSRADSKVFHIPLDLSVQSVLR
ncbi:methyltransferase domain-containing protein, partial [Ralstonia solanacearum]|uniref:methyltransferase domain-containing protein n=1 Tax=Ralstonia solanacearum TaxID=305 RepID=UPI0018D02024